MPVNILVMISQDLSNVVGLRLARGRILVGESYEILGRDKGRGKTVGLESIFSIMASRKRARKSFRWRRLPTDRVSTTIGVRGDSGTNLGTVKDLVGVIGKNHPGHGRTNMSGNTHNMAKILTR
jgi:hypothetical protein